MESFIIDGNFFKKVEEFRKSINRLNIYIRLYFIDIIKKYATFNNFTILIEKDNYR